MNPYSFQSNFLIQIQAKGEFFQISKFLPEIYNKHNLKMYFHVHKKLAWIFSLFSLNSIFFCFFFFTLVVSIASDVRLSVQFSCSVVYYSLQPHGLQHTRLPVHHQHPEFAQTHVHRVGDAIQPSHPLSAPSLPAPNSSEHQLFA